MAHVDAGEGRGSPSVGISLSRERSQLQELLNGAGRDESKEVFWPVTAVLASQDWRGGGRKGRRMERGRRRRD